MFQQNESRGMTRRRLLHTMAVAAGSGLLPAGLLFAENSSGRSQEDEAFLDDLERQGCLFFWEQGRAKTGQILDRARNHLAMGARDPRPFGEHRLHRCQDCRSSWLHN